MGNRHTNNLLGVFIFALSISYINPSLVEKCLLLKYGSYTNFNIIFYYSVNLLLLRIIIIIKYSLMYSCFVHSVATWYHSWPLAVYPILPSPWFIYFGPLYISILFINSHNSLIVADVYRRVGYVLSKSRVAALYLSPRSCSRLC